MTLYFAEWAVEKVAIFFFCFPNSDAPFSAFRSLLVGERGMSYLQGVFPLPSLFPEAVIEVWLFRLSPSQDRYILEVPPIHDVP